MHSGIMHKVTLHHPQRLHVVAHSMLKQGFKIGRNQCTLKHMAMQVSQPTSTAQRTLRMPKLGSNACISPQI